MVFDLALEVATIGMGLLLPGTGLGGVRVVISAPSTPLLSQPPPPPPPPRRKRSATRKAAMRSIRAEGAPSKPENSGGWPERGAKGGEGCAIKIGQLGRLEARRGE